MKWLYFKCMARPRPKTDATCSCGSKQTIRSDTYNANVKRNGVYTCHHCATIKAGSDGRYSHTFEIRSLQSKKLWQDEQFRATITTTSTTANTTEEYKKTQAVRTKALWQSNRYREKVVAGVVEALADPAVRIRISESLHTRYHTDPAYRLAVGKAARERFTNEEYKARMALIRANQPRISSVQLALYTFLDDLGVEYHRESANTTIGYYVFDCLIPRAGGGILIECQGNYWHSLPGAESRDRAKFSYINKYFPEYEIMYVWEHEFSNKDGVLDRLKTKLGCHIQTAEFEFHDIDVRIADKDSVKSFLDQYHYIGGSRGGVAVGAYHNKHLIGCVLFSKLIRQNHTYVPVEAVELSRLCIHPSYHKKNFASWMIARSIKINNHTSVVSFADTTVGHVGTIYKAANFKLHHEVKPDYWYVSNDGYVMHKKTLYNRAVNLKMTESEFAEKYGYAKKFGGPKLCFVYSRQK